MTVTILALDHVSVQFSGLKALSDVSFCVHAGEVCALIGPNGAGKSTLFNVITGYVAPSDGTVRFDGRDITGRPPHALASAGMRRTFQNGGIFGNMTVLENILLGLDARSPSGVFGVTFRAPSASRVERAVRKEAEALVAMMGLSALADREARDLSAGQQRLVEITRALAAHTRLLLLDEPAVGLSANERTHLMKVLRDLAADGIAVMLVEHAIDLVMAVSDRIVVLNYGEVIADGTPGEIRAHPAVLEAYLGAA